MLLVEVDNRVRVDLRQHPEAAEDLRKQFTHENPKRAQMKAAKVRNWWGEPSHIPTWGEDARGWTTFPRGGMARVREGLAKHGIQFAIRDLRRKHESDPSVPETTMVLRPFQERLAQAALAKENCLIRSGTGSGKSTILLALYARMKVPTLIIVHQIALAEQWIERAVSELGMSEDDVGMIGDGKKRVRHLTIGIPKSIAILAAKDPSFVDRWGAVFVDEVHLFAARTLFAVVDQFRARYRIGASDDERRKDRMEFLIYDQFAALAAEATDREIIETKAVFEVEVLLVPTEFEADWYACPEGDKSPDFGILVRAMADDPARNAIIDRILATELADGRQIIVFGKERDQCRQLGAMAGRRAPTGYLIGGADYRKEYRRTKVGMRAGKIRVGVGTYQACGASLDIPTVEVGIAAAPCLANRTTFRQGRGRIARRPAGKTTARFYVLVDLKVFGLRHVENAARWNPKTFVWDGGAWVPAREFLKRARIAQKEE